MTSDGFPHHSVLSHKYNSHTSQTHSDLLHLFRANIVCAHDETLWVVIQKLLHNTHSFHHTLKLMTKWCRRSPDLITDITTPATKHGFKYITPLLIMQLNIVSGDVGGSTPIISKPIRRCNSQLALATSDTPTCLIPTKCDTLSYRKSSNFPSGHISQQISP